MDRPVFVNRGGGWMSLTNVRRALRARSAVRSFVGDSLQFQAHGGRTVVRDALGAELAQQQLSHAKLATTEAHYLQRQTRGPDVRAVLDKFARRRW